MNQLLIDFATFFEETGITEGYGVDTFCDFIPEEPDNIVIISEYAGQAYMAVDNAVNRSVQISVRSTEAESGYTKINELFTILQANREDDCKVQLTDTRWCQLYLRQTPFKYKIDGNNRILYGFNVGVTTTME